MITGEIRSKVDRIWDAMWAGGIANPLTVIEQLTYLLFIKRLDELHTLREAKANRLGKPIEEPIFPEGKNPAVEHNPVDCQELRWSRFKNKDPESMFNLLRDQVFPFMKAVGDSEENIANGEGGRTSFSRHMKDALFMFPQPRLLSNVVDQLDAIDMADRDTKGDLYEYMLGKIASAGQNGQFRTPRHIIRLMVEMMAPQPRDAICDPACGTCGFLVAANEYLRDHYGSEIFKNAKSRRRFNEETFHGYDFDSTMLRIGSMNMMLHGVENPDVRYKDSLEETHAGDSEAYSLILANPPFAGSLDYESTAKDLLQIVKTKKTELLFIALFLRLLKVGGRAAVIVPDGVLFGSSKAHKSLRKMLVEDQKLDAVVSMPSGVFKPYAGVSTAILFFTKTNSGGTDHVWFYDMRADGQSLDDKRTNLLDPELLGPVPDRELKTEEHDKNNLPDILQRWQSLGRDGSPSCPQSPEHKRKRTEQSFLVSKADIASNDYDLSINRYKEVEYEEVQYDSPKDILVGLNKLEDEIAKGQKELEELIG